ncbi:MAG: hypothetical protein L0Z51_04805 [Candidatus Latescibacteria bacterium]|nr:hypothetical protein [Candidatus Latescibacterota bacterium]
MKNTFFRILKPAVIFGAIAFAIGFFGPLLWAPDANQGPLLGIFITGPLGFFVGMAWGVFRELRRSSRERNGTERR